MEKKMESNKIREIIRKYREIESDIMILKATQIASSAKLEKYSKQKIIIEAWLNLLTDEERFVIENHLVAGTTITKLLLLYENKWGKIQARDERTLKRIQANAISKIRNNIECKGFESEIERIFYS